jgi:hypothetical protein
LLRSCATLAHKYGFKYAFFWPPYISAGKTHLTEEEEALKREVDPSLAKLYASVYHTVESRIPQHANLHSCRRFSTATTPPSGSTTCT